MDSKPISRWGRFRRRMESVLTEKSLSEEAVNHPIHGFFHFWALAIRSFVRNRCPARATALAYTTLLALIPLLAVSLGVSSSLLKSDKEQTEELIERLISQMAPQLEQLPGTEQERLEARERMIQEILSFIANIHSGALGVTGTLALVFVAIGLLSTIEITFNDIWGVSRGRSWLSRIVCYWTAITLGPLIVLLAMGLAVSGQLLPGLDRAATPVGLEWVDPHTTGDAAESSAVGPDPDLAPDRRANDHAWAPVRWGQSVVRGPLGRLIFEVLPFLILSAFFALLYQLMPNTRVRWRAAAVGGVVGALLWLLNSQFNVAFAARVVAASKIYGPLGVVPVFLIGLYVSWLIVLFGAQVAYAFQNRKAYLQERLAEGTNQRGREFVALRVMVAIAGRFQRGELPPSIEETAVDLGVSSRLVSQVIEPMRRAGLLVEVNTPNPAFAPARPLELISTAEILQALRSGHGQEPGTRADSDRDRVREVYETVQRAERDAAGPITLRDLVDCPERKRMPG